MMKTDDCPNCGYTGVLIPNGSWLLKGPLPHYGCKNCLMLWSGVLKEIETMNELMHMMDDSVAVKPSKRKEKTDSGRLYLPETYDSEKQLNRASTGTVLAIGPGKVNERTGRRQPIVDISPGDAVVYEGKYAGTEVEIQGETVLIMKYHDILGVVENEHH